MSIWKGKRLTIELQGESHGEYVGINVTGFPDFDVDEEKLAAFMKRRQGGQGFGSTPRKETDVPIFLPQTEKGKFSAIVKNASKRSSDYDSLYGKPRPSHADYCSFVKDGTLDFRGGGRFSARLTAPYCIAGGIAKQFLEEKGIRIRAYVSEVGGVVGKSYKDGITEEELEAVTEGFPSLTKKEEMEEEIERARMDADSVGAVCECVVFGCPAGIGNDYFDGLEGKLAQLLFAIPAVKGVEFGAGFALADLRGSEADDPIRMDGDRVVTAANHNGGVNGGITNGMPLIVRTVVKPTPTIRTPRRTVSLASRSDAEITVHGRHDPAIAPRAAIVQTAVTALVLCDLLAEAEG